MRPEPRFAALPPSFWAHVKLVSERMGYSAAGRLGGARTLKRYAEPAVRSLLAGLGPAAERPDAVAAGGNLCTPLCDYLNARALMLERDVEPVLMERDQAAAEFERLRRELMPRCPLPMNKQKGLKRHPSYMVGIVNMLTERELGSRTFNGDPRGLTAVLRDGVPLRTLSRRMDGAYPDIVNPHAVWEVKEYYGTTTFGSRVADGVYETMLDGFELAELSEHERVRVLHYLIVDDHYTWWGCGRSYLCRIVDMLHMGLVDEVLFGREVLVRWPEIVRSWP